MRFRSKGELRDHLEREHGLLGGGGELEERVERGRGYAWVYPG